MKRISRENPCLIFDPEDVIHASFCCWVIYQQPNRSLGGPLTPKRSGGPRMSMAQLPITNSVEHRVCLAGKMSPFPLLCCLRSGSLQVLFNGCPTEFHRKNSCLFFKLLIDTRPKLAITVMPTNSRMEKQIVIDTQNGILYSRRKEQTSHPCNKKESIHRE